MLMIQNNALYTLIVVMMLASCGKIDNYKAPDGGIYGKLVDSITKDNLQNDQPNGFAIKLFENGASMTSPIRTTGKSDGTYENAFVFQKEYMVVPTDGAFFPVDTARGVKIGIHTELNFNVTPFLAVTNATVTPSAGQIKTSYTIARSRVGDKIVERKTLVSKIPTVNNVVFDYNFEDNDLSGTPDDTLLSTNFSDVVTGLTSGNTYYVRIAVRTDNPLQKYNYSKVFTVKIP
jgi:hypothetical protein